jgi:uncharacterized protein YprB with RNaseH-like and TPR domain
VLAPVNRLTKAEIIQLARGKCKHSHTYLDHYSCYLKENPDQGKTGFLDIETSNLKGNYGLILTYCLKIKGEDKILSRSITKQELNTCLDKQVVKQAVDDIQTCDRLVTYYGTKFDLPFLRTRAVMNGLDFPEFGQIYHTDVYYKVRNKFCLNSNRLQVACESLLGRSDKTRMDPFVWISALQGNPESLSYIYDHCVGDVLDLEKLHDLVCNFSGITKTSI